MKRTHLSQCRNLLLALLVAVLTLGTNMGITATGQEDKVVLLEDNFDVSPWLANNRRNPAAPMILDGALDRSKLANQGLQSYELEDVGGQQHAVMRWNLDVSRVVVVWLKVNPNRDAIIAASEPEGYLRCRLLASDNAKVYVWVGGRKHHLEELTEYEMSTSFEYASKLGKYDKVGDIGFQVVAVDEEQPYSGAVAFLNYRVEGSPRNPENIDKHVAIANMSEGYRGEVSVPHDTTETVELAGVVGEPLCFSVKFNTPVNNAMVTADIPCDNVRVRWLANWKTFLLNDPSLGGGGGELDAPTMIRVLAGPGEDSSTEKAWISFVVTQASETDAPDDRPLVTKMDQTNTLAPAPAQTTKKPRSRRSRRREIRRRRKDRGLPPAGSLAPVRSRARSGGLTVGRRLAPSISPLPASSSESSSAPAPARALAPSGGLAPAGEMREQDTPNAPPPTPLGTIAGTVTVSDASGPINTINVRVTVYTFALVEKAAVRPGIYVVTKRYDEEYWDGIHEWTGRARIEWMTNPVQVPMKCLGGKDPDGRAYQQDALYRAFQSRRSHGSPEKDLFITGLLGYELWRFLYGPPEDKYDLDTWIGQSAAEKIAFTRQQFADDGVNDIWVYSWDEAMDDKLMRQVPLFQVIRASGARIFAAIHAHFWEVPEMRESIDLWIMTERNYRFSQKLRSYNKLTARYGYPFTDVHGYDVHRLEFMNALYSGVDFYYNYALNDINGATFDSQRKMGLIFPTEGGIIETGSSEGFIRGVYDMKYIATLKKLADDALEENPNNTTAQQALEYLELLNPKTDYNAMKTQLVERIQALLGG